MNVLMVEDESVVRAALGGALTRHWSDARLTWAASLPEAVSAIEKTGPDVVTVDLGLPPDPDRLQGLELVERLVKDGRGDRAVVVTGRLDAVDAAKRAGAKVVLLKPFRHEDVRDAGRRLGIPLVGDDPSLAQALACLVGASPPMVELREAVRRVAKEDGSVLVQGETGTGKELVARAIHRARGKGPFHAVNCSILDALAESQLLGHARGAFTSAVRAARGAVEQAGEGVLFLDEIGDLARALQPKLLRLLEGSRVQALGADERWFELRARLVAASRVDLETCVAAGTFREDLYYRLAVHVIRVPPLRERTEDMPVLVQVLLQRLARPKTITEDAVAVLAGLHPGRERAAAGGVPGACGCPHGRRDHRCR